MDVELEQDKYTIQVKWPMKNQIGKVTEEERDEIQDLFERKSGLNELAQILTIDNNELYEKLVKDLGETGTKFSNWWDRMASKYSWESHPDGNWEIDFDSCEIYLVTPDKEPSL